MMMCLLGLLRTERLASEMSAVTRVMEILRDGARGVRGQGGLECSAHAPRLQAFLLAFSPRKPRIIIQAHPAHPQ